MTTALRLTTEAADFIRTSLAGAKADAIGVRLGVKKAGCSGYEYVVEFAYEQKSHDQIFEHEGAKVVVDEESFEKFLKGTTVDYRKEGLNIGLVFDNPNVQAQCGCGESFALKSEQGDDAGR